MEFALAPPRQRGTTPASPADPWSAPALRLVCLDIDDTLIDFSASSSGALAAVLGRDDLWPLWEAVTDRHVAMVVAGDLDYAAMHRTRTQSFLAEIGRAVCVEEAASFERRRLELLRRSWRLFDDVLPCLEWLRAAGVHLAAVTNASGAHQRTKLADLGLARFFDHIAIAGEMGVAKPDPVMFHTVCLALGCDPGEAVHVGDKLDTDAMGAADAGLGAVWLDRSASGAEVPRGVHVLEGLAELPELLVCEFARVGVPSPR
ncbi:HAD family hydrolase [Amycolatopsis magusensis]|uniref:Hydrolase of the HAD superfamily n=1 Tax=Amycolatopsis magusensis TaxID=882444 RepID=A0ABS4Q4W9_9PSEU|nr:HAD family hydrolase [Amycolatopsis magusensis]MBP2186730.1 putative hydrolase of the HAD superfamily [Amycolatopsis magusensis]